MDVFVLGLTTSNWSHIHLKFEGSSLVFFRCVHLLWLPTAAVKTLQYGHATVRSRINTTRPLPFSNYRKRAKLHLRDLLNLIKSQDFIKLPS